MFFEAESAAGGFDLVINNAGYGAFAPFAAADFSIWQQQLEVMLINTARLAHAALRGMLPRDHGALVNISSIAAEFPLPFQSAYNIAKSGLSALKNLPGDDAILQQIAVVYLRRAQIEGDQQRWAAQAAEYAEKALAAHPGDQINLYSSARAFEIAADFSAARRCEYYARSAALLQQRLPLLVGEHLTMNGRPAPPEPLRQENEFLLARVKMKSKKNGCP